MFSSTSALRVVPYTPKVPGSITHKLPAKPSWRNAGEQTVNPQVLLKKVPGDGQRGEKHSDVGESLFFPGNSTLDTKATEGNLNRVTDTKGIALSDTL